MTFSGRFSRTFRVAVAMLFLGLGAVCVGIKIAYGPETNGERASWEAAKIDLRVGWTKFLERFTPARLVREQSIGRYVVRHYERKYDRSWRLQVLDGKTAVYDLQGGKKLELFETVDWRIYAGAGKPLLPDRDFSAACPDITGDGRPKLFVSMGTGGAHCCWDLAVFELEKEFKAVASFENVYGDRPRFEDLDHDGVMEAIVLDGTFDYAFTAHAGSPFPEIVLRRTKGVYVFADDLMRKPPLAVEGLEELIREVRSEFDDPDALEQNGVPAALYNETIQLIYSGNAGQGWKLFDWAWPPGKPGKQEEEKRLQALLSRSPWWSEVSKMQPRGASRSREE